MYLFVDAIGTLACVGFMHPFDFLRRIISPHIHALAHFMYMPETVYMPHVPVDIVVNLTYICDAYMAQIELGTTLTPAYCFATALLGYHKGSSVGAYISTRMCTHYQRLICSHV